MERTHVTARDLSRHTSEVLDRVAAGERLEVTRDGVPVAVLSPPDAVEVVTQRLVKTGILDSDRQARQERTLRRLAEHRKPGRPGEPLASEVLAEMRGEESS